MTGGEQFLLFFEAAISISAIGYTFALVWLHRLNKIPSFAIPDFEEVDQYPLWNGELSRTLHLRIENTTNWLLGWWPNELRASLRLIGKGKVDERGWLSWKNVTDPPDHVRIPPKHSQWVRVLSVTEREKDVFVPLGSIGQAVHPTPVPSGGYDVELILHCSLWRNQKVLYKRHWQLPEDLLKLKFKTS